MLNLRQFIVGVVVLGTCCSACAVHTDARSGLPTETGTRTSTATAPPDKNAIMSSIRANSPLRSLSESDREKLVNSVEAQGRFLVSQWVEAFAGDSTKMTRAILQLPTGEGTGLPVTGPAASLAESGKRASLIVHGSIVAVGAEPSGLLFLTVHPNGEPESEGRKITLRAVIRSENGMTIIYTAGQFLPTSLTDVVIVTDRIEGADFPQPETGVYVVGLDGRVKAQPGSPLADQTQGMPVQELLHSLGAQ